MPCLSSASSDKGKSLVCLYGGTLDAQVVYHADLVAYYMQSVKASLDQSQLMTYIVMACIGMDCHGSTVSFILHWLFGAFS